MDFVNTTGLLTIQDHQTCPKIFEAQYLKVIRSFAADDFDASAFGLRCALQARGFPGEACCRTHGQQARRSVFLVSTIRMQRSVNLIMPSAVASGGSACGPRGASLWVSEADLPTFDSVSAIAFDRLDGGAQKLPYVVTLRNLRLPLAQNPFAAKSNCMNQKAEQGQIG